MTYCARGVSRDVTCGPDEGTNKKERNFHVSNWLFAQTTHVDVSPWNFACGACPAVTYFKFHENRLRGLGAAEGRKSHAPIDLAHGLFNSLYTVPYKPWYPRIHFMNLRWTLDGILINCCNVRPDYNDNCTYVLKARTCKLTSYEMKVHTSMGIGDYYSRLWVRNDLYCVGWNVKLYSFTHSDNISDMGSWG